MTPYFERMSRRTASVFDHVVSEHRRFAWWCSECRRRWLIDSLAVAIAASIVFGLVFFLYRIVDLLTKAVAK